jgi:hypothetical protein
MIGLREKYRKPDYLRNEVKRGLLLIKWPLLFYVVAVLILTVVLVIIDRDTEFGKAGISNQIKLVAIMVGIIMFMHYAFRTVGFSFWWFMAGLFLYIKIIPEILVYCFYHSEVLNKFIDSHFTVASLLLLYMNFGLYFIYMLIFHNMTIPLVNDKRLRLVLVNALGVFLLTVSYKVGLLAYSLGGGQ